jgi:RNA polymerase sigma factor (sigma-70 family)
MVRLKARAPLRIAAGECECRVQPRSAKVDAQVKAVPGSNGDAKIELMGDLFRHYRRVLARAVARIVRPADVEDVVQETYLRVFQAALQQPIRHPRSFMLTAARNVALNYLARTDALNHLETTPRETVESITELDFDTEGVSSREVAANSAESVAQSEEEFLTFCRAVRELPLQCRRAFVLKKVYGFSQREIAKELGLSESTVEKHIAKGLAVCSAYMVERGYAQGNDSFSGDTTTIKRGCE